MSKIIIFDYEVFKFDTLLGCIIRENGTRRVFQEWDFEKIKKFFEENKNALWVGHNNYYYDDLITESIVFNKNPYETSQKLIGREEYLKLKLKFPSIDLMKLKEGKDNEYKLKLTELLCGKNIHESEIDFNLPRALTEEEKKQVEGYNYDDLDQTEYNFLMMQESIKLKIGIIQKFSLNFIDNIRSSMTNIASKILFSEYKSSLQYAKMPIVMYDNLIINNEDVKEFYLQEHFKTDKEIQIKLCGTEVKLSGEGALHGSIKKFFSDKVLYADVTGFYNLIAIVYDLLPRTLSEEGKKRYTEMYYEQLKLKKTNPVQREQYKTVLLAVIGSMKLKESPFYDPETYTLLTMTGKLFMIDLLEKLEGLALLVQVNTDGLMLEPYNWEDEPKIKAIIKEWSDRTKFSIKVENLYRLWQRDVNCYVCADEEENIIAKGDVLKNYDISDKAYAKQSFFKCKEPPIIAQGIVNLLMYNIKPEEFVSQNKKNLKLFQYFCQKTSKVDYLTYDTINLCTKEQSTELLQGVDRVFALKSSEILGTVYKHSGTKFGKHKISKYPSLPDNVFVYNYALNDFPLDFYDKIDYQYYIDRIYQKIKEFI